MWFCTALVLSTSSFAAPANAKWSLKLALIWPETVEHLSAPNDRVAWVFTSKNRLYVTENGGQNWRHYPVAGLADDVFTQELVALDADNALLTGNTGFTGVGPGFVYRTSDSGRHWQKVFKHALNCDFRLAMGNAGKGLLAVNYSHFSLPSKNGQALYITHDAGRHWTQAGITNPTDYFYIKDLFVKNNQAWLVAENKIFYSANLGKKWSYESLPALEFEPVNLLQFENPRHGIFNASSLIDLYLKQPPSKQWQHLGDPTGLPFLGAVTALVIDKNECWLTEALDNLHNFYSKDLCKTFTPFIVDPDSAFFYLEKVNGSNALWAATKLKIYRTSTNAGK